MHKKTDLQKERFKRYYGLKPIEFKKDTLSAIAREQHCTPNVIRSSVVSIRLAMFRIAVEDFSMLETVYKKYHE